MSYEKTAVADSTAAIPTSQPQQMREAREISPYANVKASQPVINSSEAAEPAKSAETVTLSPQMAALARKEQKFRQNEQAIKAREAALEERAAKLAKMEALEAKIRSGDYSDIDELVGYDKFTQWKLDKANATTPEQEALKKLEEKLGGVEKAMQDDVTKRFEAAVNERRNAVKQLVETDTAYASIKKLNMQEAVVQHILDTWEHDNTELTPAEAAKEVSEILKEKAKTWSSILEEAPAPAVEDKKSLPPLKQGIKTLTNQMTQTGDIKRPNKPLHGMSDGERYAEARRRAEEKLKQGIKV